MSTSDCLLSLKHFQATVSSSFRDSRMKEEYSDVSVAVEGGQVVKCHKIILAACSSVFRNILSGMKDQSHPIIYLRGVKVQDLHHVLDFLYEGKVVVAEEDVRTFLALAEDLQIKGMSEHEEDKSSSGCKPVEPPSSPISPVSVNQVIKVEYLLDNPGPVGEDKDAGSEFDAQEDENMENARSDVSDEAKDLPNADDNDDIVEDDEEFTELCKEVEQLFADRIKPTDSGYECLVCGKTQRSRRDCRRHVITHFNHSLAEMEVKEFLLRVDKYIVSKVGSQDRKSFCKFCNKFLSKNSGNLRSHFILRHLRTEKPSS